MYILYQLYEKGNIKINSYSKIKIKICTIKKKSIKSKI